jgi:hypothetical protein
MADKTFNEMISDLRRMGLSQAAIGVALDRHQTTVWEWENKGIKRLPYETAKALKKFHADQMKLRDQRAA